MQKFQEISMSNKDQAVIDFMKSVMSDPELARKLVLNREFIELVVQYREYFI